MAINKNVEQDNTAKKTKEVKKKTETFEFEIPTAQGKKFKARCESMGIEENRAFELLVRGFLTGEYKFKSKTEYYV